MMKKKPFWDGGKLLAVIAENWHVKVLSVALAIILFVFHRMSLLEDRFFSAPLQVETNGNLVPASSYPRMVRITLRGEANSIYPILEDDIEAYLDLTKYTVEGAYRAPVQVRKKGTALGVEPLEISVDPLDVSIELDQKISKYVPLTPSFQGYLEGGYELVSYTLTPTQVVVDGPLRLMSGLSELSTDFIELGGRSDDFTATVRIMNRDPLLVIRGDGITEFRGLVRQFIVIRSFENLPIEMRGLNEDLEGTPAVENGSIRLEGPQGELGSFEPRKNILYLDCSQITEPGVYPLPVQADIPQSFTLTRSDPSYVTVRAGPRSKNGAGDELP
jgi:YbbR domain-containing protein